MRGIQTSRKSKNTGRVSDLPGIPNCCIPLTLAIPAWPMIVGAFGIGARMAILTGFATRCCVTCCWGFRAAASTIGCLATWAPPTAVRNTKPCCPCCPGAILANPAVAVSGAFARGIGARARRAVCWPAVFGNRGNVTDPTHVCWNWAAWRRWAYCAAGCATGSGSATCVSANFDIHNYTTWR